MGYITTLEAAGAKVIEFKETGSYQGSWGAIVEYKGQRALVTGSYGSCSYCDAYEAEFGYDDNKPEEEDGKYYRGPSYNEAEITKEEYDELLTAYQKRLADFGMSYLQTLQGKWDIENRLKGFDDDDYFDSEEKELYTWALTHFPE